MKKVNLKSKKSQHVKDNQKISHFFTKVGTSSTKFEQHASPKQRNCQIAGQSTCAVTALADNDEDVIPCTPNVRPVKKIAGNGSKERGTARQNGEKVLEVITNTEARKRKTPDCEEEAVQTRSANLRSLKKVDRKLDVNEANASYSSEDEFQSKVKSKRRVNNGVNNLSVKSPEKLFNSHSNFHVEGVLSKNCLDEALTSCKKSSRRSPRIKRLIDKAAEKTPTKADISPDETLTSLSKSSTSPKIRRASERLGRVKKSPQKLFSKSPNVNQFKVEIIESFVTITPGKSKRKAAQVGTPVKSGEKKQASILKFVSPSKSVRAVEAQQKNESTPTKSQSDNVQPSTSKAKMKLDFAFGKPSVPNENKVDSNLPKNVCDDVPALNNTESAFKDEGNPIRSANNVALLTLSDTVDRDVSTNNVSLNNVLALEDWDEEFSFTSQQDCVLDLHEMQHCVVKEVTKLKNKVCLVLQATKAKDKAKCTLEGFWIHCRLHVGCTVYVCATKGDTDWKITNEHGLLVYEPDILISSTSIVGAIFCKRRSIFKERFWGFEPENRAMVIGVLVHALLQRVLKTRTTTSEGASEILNEILATEDTIRLMYASSLTAEDLERDLSEFVPRIVTFMSTYVTGNKMPAINTQDWQGRIDAVQDIEENIWCPELGVKGKVDVTVRCGSNVMPLELKTGRTTMSLEHRGQVVLYVMMMSKLGYNVSSGLLLYLREGVLREIPYNPPEKRDLVLLRNELTYYLTRKSQVKKPSGDNATGTSSLVVPELPDPINHHSACAKCPYNILCCSYLRHENVDLSNNKPLASVRDEVLAHLSTSHLDYFIRWSGLLDLESTEKSGKSLRSIYTQTPQEREKYGRCITSVEVTDTVVEYNGFYKQTFQKTAPSTAENLLTTGIGESSYVVVSTDSRPAVAAGLVTHMDRQSVTIALDRDLNLKYPAHTFHLDSYDSNSAHSFNYTNLTLLLEPTETAERLRRFIIDGEVPTFEKKFPRVIANKATPILKTLNRLQQRAVLKALAANDYLLIKGMPGTGKTATIVALVRLLMVLDRTVLITSHTHMAVDNVCIRLKECGIGFLRLGAEAKIHPTLRSMSESALTRDCKTAEDLENVYGSARILAVTCLGSKHPVLSKRVMDVCIVDESTQVLQCSVFRALTASKKFILFGDPDQLPPVVRSREAVAGGLAESLFERLQGSESMVALTHQYRMNQPITDLANNLTYRGQLLTANDGVGNATLQLRQLKNFHSKYKERQWIIETLDCRLSSSVRVLDTGPTWNLKIHFPWARKTSTNGTEDNEILSCTNPSETAIVLALVDALITAEVPANTIGVISPYRAQAAQISSLLQHTEIDISTVDQFQGQDKEVIIYSCTKSRDLSKNVFVSQFDILEDRRRLTVAVTRVRHKFVLIGDVGTLKLYTPFARLLRGIASDSFLTLRDGESGFSWGSIAAVNNDLRVGG